MPSLSAYKSALDYSYAPGIFPSMECLTHRPENVRRLLVHSSAAGREGADRLCALAEELALPVAHKKDSMEICFIPDKDYVGWLSRRGELPGPGAFVFHGETIGRHEGIIRWTGGRFRMMPQYSELGYDESRLFCYRSKEGEAKERTYLVWTPRGKTFIEGIVDRLTD